MIGAVTAGWARVNASARWISDRPDLSASSASASAASSLRWFSGLLRSVAGGHPLGAARLRHVLALAVAAGQPAACQRAPRQHAEPVALRHRQQVRLDAAHEDRVRRLLGDEPAQPPALRRPLRLDHLVRRERRRAEGADLALPLQVGQRGESLLDVRAGLGPVHLVEVDPVGLQPPQAVLDLLDDPASRVAPLVRVAAGLAHGHVHRAVELRGEDDIVAPASGQRLSHDHLRLALAVDVGGVDEVDACVQCAMDDPDRRVVVRLAPCAEHHRPEAERADLHSCASETAVLHASTVRAGRSPRRSQGSTMR